MNPFAGFKGDLEKNSTGDIAPEFAPDLEL
jgi:hypothetical protein